MFGIKLPYTSIKLVFPAIFAIIHKLTMRKFNLENILGGMKVKWLAVAVIAVFSVILIGTAGVARASESGNNNANEKRLVTIYDDGTERTILTHANTVEKALNDAGIVTEKADDIEPKLDAKLTDTSTNIIIYRARPVVVIDGSRQIRVVTAAQTQTAIAEAANLTLDPADKTELKRVNDMLTSGGAGLQLIITRAKTVNLILYGNHLTLKTQAKTIAELLDEKNIKLAADDFINTETDTVITDNMNLEIWREGKQTVTAEEEIAFTSQTINDPTKEKGQREVRTAGVNGKRSVTYEIDMKNGQEVARQEIQSVEIAPSVTEVIIVGTKTAGPAYNPNGTHEEWMRAAGIAPENFAYVEFLVARESGWNPNAVNRSSGACGLPQALPCSKLGPNWNNPVVALSWMNGYVGRYGGWAGAYNFWMTHHWY